MRDYGQIIETVFVSSRHLFACIYLIIQREISTWSFLGVKEQENFKKIFKSSLKHKKTINVMIASVYDCQIIVIIKMEKKK